MRGLEAHATKNPSQPRTYLASRLLVVPAAGFSKRAWRSPSENQRPRPGGRASIEINREFVVVEVVGAVGNPEGFPSG